MLEEQESKHPDHPNYVFTRLGPIASGGLLGVRRSVCKNFKIQVDSNCDECECEQLKQEIAGLKESLRNCEIEDEVKQPSINDEIARQLVESNIKVINKRYEIPVPLKMDVVTNLLDNYVCTLKRTTNFRRNAPKNIKLKDILGETFQEIIFEGWIVPADDAILSDTKCWYLPFFVTKQDKARVVFDGTATFKEVALNDAVHSGINLLNNLIEVLTKFRVERHACTAYLSKCFFHVAMPESQRDLFRLIWYRNNDLDKGKARLYRFTRHVWGINSGHFIALLKFLAVDNKICTYGTFKWLAPSSPPFAISGDVVKGICFIQLAVDVATD